jgi:hypothetical protein
MLSMGHFFTLKRKATHSDFHLVRSLLAGRAIKSRPRASQLIKVKVNADGFGLAAGVNQPQDG